MSQNVTMASINSLPPELLVRIFQYLNQIDLEVHVVPVCHLWKDLVVQFIPWKLEMFGKRITGGTNLTLEEFLEIGIKVSDVSICFPFEDERDFMLQDIPDYSLTGRTDCIVPEPFRLGTLNTAFPELRKLQITGDNINLTQINTFHNLLHLTLGKGTQISVKISVTVKWYHQKPVQYCSEVLLYCPQLKRLDIENACVVSSNLTRAIASLENLECLGLQLCHEVNVKSVLIPLHSHPKLKKLESYFHAMGNILDASTFLLTLPVLEDLSIHCAMISSTMAMDFFKNLPLSLKELRITAYSTYIQETHIHQIYETLPDLRVLKVKCSTNFFDGRKLDFLDGRQVELEVETEDDYSGDSECRKNSDDLSDSYSDSSY